MIKKILIAILLSLNLFSNIIVLNEKSNNINITPQLKLLVDHTKSKTFKEIIQRDKEFQRFTKYSFDFGYIVDSTVWVKVSFKNNSKKAIKKIVSYSDPLISEFYMYENGKKIERIQGIKFRSPTLENLHHYFEINLEPAEKKEYFFQFLTHYSSTAGHLKVWNKSAFFNQERIHFLIISSFFVSLSILFIYNIFLYFFSFNKIYLSYVFYIFSIGTMHTITTGFLYTLVEPSLREYTENNVATMVLINLMVLSSLLFQKYFLNMKQYKKLNRSLTFIFFIISLLTILLSFPHFFHFLEYDIYIAYLCFIWFFYIGIYASIKKNPYALYFTFGWGLTIFANMAMTTHFLGFYPVLMDFPYIVETFYLLEGLLFSFILAKQLKTLEKEKNLLNQKLLIQQKSENIRLEKEVINKTKELKEALNIQENLLRELHHRVKNNMQIIISIIRLQYRQIRERKIQKKFIEIENRINAMSKVHEFLYNKKVLDSLTTQYYLENLGENIKNTFADDYKVVIDVRCDVEFNIEDLIYIGLIVNELILNAFKYAFPKKTGRINIDFFQKNDFFILKVQDNGTGTIGEKRENSLGLLLVDTLATKQLGGEVKTFNNNGTIVEIIF